MRRWLTAIAILLAGITLVPTQAQEKDKKADGPVQIIWHGHSFFEIKSSKGTLIVTDPHLIPEYGRLIEPLKADILTMSHNHTDHTQVTAVSNFRDKDIKIFQGIRGAGKNAQWNIVDEKVKDVRVKSVGVYHDNMEGLKNGKNTIFIFEVDGWRIAHLGDIGHALTPAQLRAIGPVDVVMVPVGGIYTVNGSEAKDLVAQLKPKEYVFPMHYGTKVFDELLTIDEFLDGVEKRRVAKSDDNKMILDRNPMRPRPLIVQLHYWGKK